MYVSAFINLSDSVTGIVDRRSVFLRGFVLAFVLIWIDARVSRVVSAVYECTSVKGAPAETSTCSREEDATGCEEYCYENNN